jgi:RimJ/RimL family protein N-acetyltransferase
LDASDVAKAPRELHSQRLVLHAPKAEFAPLFFESLTLSLPGLRYISWGQNAPTLEWAEKFMVGGLKWIAEGDCLIFYAFDKTTGAYVGRVDLHSWHFEAPRCEVGYVGDVRQAGKGLMREAVLACVDLVFSMGVVRVQALSEASNHHALKFAEQALGFTREGVLRNFERDAQGQLGEQVMFAAYKPAAV